MGRRLHGAVLLRRGDGPRRRPPALLRVPARRGAGVPGRRRPRLAAPDAAARAGDGRALHVERRDTLAAGGPPGGGPGRPGGAVFSPGGAGIAGGGPAAPPPGPSRYRPPRAP